MQDCTPTPYFPQDLENYAPWVAEHGLRQPYGECQCGCHGTTKIVTRSRPSHGWEKGHPIRFIPGHQTACTVMESFLRVLVPGNPDECWPWGGGVDSRGYGYIKIRAGRYKAHRLSYEYHNSTTIPDGLVVRHMCNNPVCVNPKHLAVGTHQDNVNDKIRSGRQPRGEGHHNTGLTDADIVAIRSLRATGLMHKEIAEIYGVGSSAIRFIVNRRTWAHVP